MLSWQFLLAPVITICTPATATLHASGVQRKTSPVEGAKKMHIRQHLINGVTFHHLDVEACALKSLATRIQVASTAVQWSRVGLTVQMSRKLILLMHSVTRKFQLVTSMVICIHAMETLCASGVEMQTFRRVLARQQHMYLQQTYDAHFH